MSIYSQFVPLAEVMLTSYSHAKARAKTSVLFRIPLNFVFLSIQLLEQLVLAMPTQLNDIRVLLVEDEPDIAELFTYVLEHNGAEVIAATTALEALQLLSEQHLQILVCNLRLPDLDGRQLLQQIRQLPDPTVSSMPAIAVTSYDREFNAENALRAGFDHFLLKPVETDSLVQAILQLTA